MFSLLPQRNRVQGKDTTSKMFSDLDVQELLRGLQPPSLQRNGSGTLPELVWAQSGEGLLTADHLFHSFEVLVTREKTRISIMRVSHELDVDKDTILQLVQASPRVALLSEDHSMIITTEERKSILANICEALKHCFISKLAYSKQHDVSKASLNDLILSPEFDESVEEVDEYLVGKSYENTLFTELKEKLESSIKNAEPLTISSSCVTGSPPFWFIKRVFDQVIAAQNLSSEIVIAEQAESIGCVPKSYLVQASKELISELEFGTRSYIDKEAFADRFGVLYPSSKEINELFVAFPFVFVSDPFAISKPYLSDRAARDLPSLEQNGGYLDIGLDWFLNKLPRTTAEEIAKALMGKAIELSNPLPTHIRQTGGILFVSSSYDRDVETLLKATENLAREYASKDVPTKDLKFQLADVIHTIPAIAQTVVSSHDGGRLEKTLADHFWTTISTVESQNESEFAAFWTKRVVSRQKNYCKGLDGIEDAKLRDQLAELLSTYIRKELVPDTLSKARTQGLMRSSKTVKNAQRLESNLASGRNDLPSIVSSLDKFEKKQEMAETETISLEEAKRALVGDMMRRMQKPKTDGPLLFLTLVVILTAKHYPGVVYATGKYAPKLLKQLKFKLSAEDYEQLEKWKEMAKSGTLGSEDQKLMVHMAEQI